jgi:UDP-2,3-diacylglucosamine pyrophosphatase LpxH
MLILFNRFVNFILKAFGREKLSISKKVMAGVNKAVAKINDFEMIAAELAIEKKYDYVICGHIHQPQKRIVENGKGKVTYLNSGDWVEHLTALEYHQSEWKIFEYNEKDFQHADLNMKVQVNVITDEISFYINSLAG